MDQIPATQHFPVEGGTFEGNLVSSSHLCQAAGDTVASSREPGAKTQENPSLPRLSHLLSVYLPQTLSPPVLHFLPLETLALQTSWGNCDMKLFPKIGRFYK